MLTTISIFFISSGIIIALIIADDLMRNKQSMKIMNAVWILTGLWGSYPALWAYFKFGRENVQKKETDQDMEMMPGMKMEMKKSMPEMGDMPMNMPMEGINRPHWQSVALSALHCGAGCTLADIIGEGITYYFPISIGGSLLIGTWVFDFVLALIIGIYFQFYAIREMEKIPVTTGVVRAFKADFFSLTSWQVGMYGWMALVYFVFFKSVPLEKDSWSFWFMMQISMLMGFACAYPMNALLIKLGIKKGM